MKTDNKNIILYFRIFNILIILLIIFSIFISTDIILHRLHFSLPYILAFVILLLIYISSKTGNQFFSIDTKGETLTFETRNVGFFSSINSRINKIDLPKYKLVKYEYNRGLISKEIVFYINSKNKTNLSKRRFKLAFISNQSINDILNELEQIVETNHTVKNNLETVI